ncbi:putative tail assembly protein [Serratia phage vB_SmaS_Niamh]|uniref:Tail assembly protein n=1 Tax=Serratia phage vB_SmaS_Ulliraptor TaxID=2902694 RepID=A0AC61TNX9_9CAUD|nr:putative tail assembly protein [Serratia phage vB_SmaS_Ulliraptor]QPX74388.1 putative bacteriophage tail assembly [Serratia phage vB_SmaS_Serratianator]UGO52028.1 putative tail assembly protein [Serratia phage vB_SmaS_Ulliraptor]UGO52991.1 putative tail assembly protein [Serratia phage vB_SmaS_Niamh]
MAKVYLHGNLKKYGECFEVFAPTFDKCLKIIMCQVDGLKKDIESGYFEFSKKSEVLSGESEESASLEVFNYIRGASGHNDEFHITPAVAGAGSNGGIFTIVAGVVAVAAAFWTGGASIAAWSAATWGLAASGALMVISGVAAVSTKLPGATAPKATESSKNTAFSSIENVMGNGQVIPLLYGENMIGSMVVSQQIDTLPKAVD